MKLDDALSHATAVAHLVLQGSRALSRKTLNTAPLMATLSISAAAKSRDAAAFDTKIKEILIFGSVARGEANPNDIDMMIFDRGFYSNIIGFEPGEAKDDDLDEEVTVTPGKRPRSSWGAIVRGNLSGLLSDWFRCSAEQCAFAQAIPIDAQILPISIILEPQKRREVGAKHFDPRFFENAFSVILRFDEVEGKFVPTTLAELVEKHARPTPADLVDARY